MKAAAVCIGGNAVRPKAKQRQPYHQPVALSHTHKGHRITCWQRDMPRIQTRRIISNARGRVCAVRAALYADRMRLCFGTQKQSGGVRGTKKSLSLQSPFFFSGGACAIFAWQSSFATAGRIYLRDARRFPSNPSRGPTRNRAVGTRLNGPTKSILQRPQKLSLCGSRCGTNASLDDLPISHVSVISAIVTQLFYRRAHWLAGRQQTSQVRLCEQTSFVAQPSFCVELRNTQSIVACIVWFWVQTLRLLHFFFKGRFFLYSETLFMNGLYYFLLLLRMHFFLIEFSSGHKNFLGSDKNNQIFYYIFA